MMVSKKLNVKSRSLAKQTRVVLRIPVDINKKTGKCKYLKFEFPVSPKYKAQVVEFLKKKFSTGKFKAKVTLKYVPWKLEVIQDIEAFHGPDIKDQMTKALTAQIKSEMKSELNFLSENAGSYMCYCNHSLKDHDKGNECSWSYNCGCKSFRCIQRFEILPSPSERVITSSDLCDALAKNKLK